MKIGYKVLIFLGATIVLIISIIWFARTDGFWSWASSLCAIWFAMAWVATLYLLIPFQLPEWYYRSYGFEKSGRVYEILGAHHFRKILRRGPIHILAPAYEYSGKREYLPVLVQESRIAEVIHVLAFLATIILIAFALYANLKASSLWLLFYNVPLNLYPILLQRYNRIRLKKLL